MLSVFDTLKETLLLWMRSLGVVAVVCLFTDLPVLFLNAEVLPLVQSVPFQAIFYSLLILVISTLLQSARVAAVLGLLVRSAPDSVWASAWKTIRRYYWTLLRMSLILMAIGLGVGIVFGFLMASSISVADRSSRIAPLIAILGGAIFLLFLKYAVAEPLIVLDKMNARGALARSWGMTKGCFWYVLGCYLFLGLISWGVSMAIQSLPGCDPALGLISIPGQFGGAVLDASWTFLGWCLYHRIKAKEAADPLPNEELANLSPPESPSAP